jgi:SAM-dependent methyltransferase
VASSRDRWAEWLAERRFGGDQETRERALSNLVATRDKVLDRAGVGPGDSLLDVGCGEGLIGFGALARGAASVTFSDISTDLLDVCRQAAEDLDVLDRCAFVEASASALGPIGDAEVDAVTTRSVLIYVKEKAAAFGEFARVLRPGGRISLFEPINRFALRDANTWGGYDLSPVAEIAVKVRAIYNRIQPYDTDPMLDFDERDLVRLAENAGFFPISLTLEAVIEPLPRRSWQGFLDSAGNPNIPTFGEAMAQTLTGAEHDRLTAHLRPLVEQGSGTWRMATAYLHANKPTTP